MKSNRKILYIGAVLVAIAIIASGFYMKKDCLKMPVLVQQERFITVKEGEEKVKVPLYFLVDIDQTNKVKDMSLEKMDTEVKTESTAANYGRYNLEKVEVEVSLPKDWGGETVMKSGEIVFEDESKLALDLGTLVLTQKEKNVEAEGEKIKKEEGKFDKKEFFEGRDEVKEYLKERGAL